MKAGDKVVCIRNVPIVPLSIKVGDICNIRYIMTGDFKDCYTFYTVEKYEKNRTIRFVFSKEYGERILKFNNYFITLKDDRKIKLEKLLKFNEINL